MPEPIRVGQVWREIEKRESVCDVTRVQCDDEDPGRTVVILRERGSGVVGPINALALRRLYTLEGEA